MSFTAALLRYWWLKVPIVLIAALLLAMLVDHYTHWSWTWGKLVAKPGLTLLGPNEHELVDQATGLHFTLPEDYSVQAQSLPVPGDTGAEERMIAKCKRNWDGTPDGKLPAWMQISDKNEPADKPLDELAKAKKPETDQQKLLKVEGFEIDGNPAARARFEMTYHEHDYIREVVAVRQGRARLLRPL